MSKNKKQETAGSEEVDLDLGIDMESMMNEVMRSVTPAMLRTLRSQTGVGLDDLESLEIEDQLQFMAYVQHRGDDPNFTWDDADDVSPFGPLL